MTNLKAQMRLEQPLSFIKGVEPDFEVFDLVVSQQQVEDLDFSDVDANELAEDIKQLICESDPKYRRYMDVTPDDVAKFTVDYDNYPEPIRGPAKGVQVAVCFAKSWSKDWGGEIIGFTECEPDDIIASFPGRIVIAKSNAWWKISQPNVRASDKLNYLFFTLQN